MDKEQQIRRCLVSYEQLLGHELLKNWRKIDDLVAALDAVDFALLSHGTEADPIFNYGNRATLARFEMAWEDFIQTPSRKSAEPMNRDERRALLDRVTRDNYIDDYAGIRISATGKRFRIEQAVVWNLFDEAGEACGQAATFSQVTPISG